MIETLIVWRAIFIAIAVVLVLFVAALVFARARAPVREFKATNPCPSTGVADADAPCPGWVVDHIVPLCFGGADALENMDWERRDRSYIKDGFERAACKLKPHETSGYAK